MPRQGEGHVAHNAYEQDSHEIGHGIPQDSKIENSAVDRSNKAAELPEQEKGAGLQDLPASAGHSQGLAQGQGAGQGGRGM